MLESQSRSLTQKTLTPKLSYNRHWAGPCNSSSYKRVYVAVASKLSVSLCVSKSVILLTRRGRHKVPTMLSQNQKRKASSASEEDNPTTNNQRSDFIDIYGPQVLQFSPLRFHLFFLSQFECCTSFSQRYYYYFFLSLQ